MTVNGDQVFAYEDSNSNGRKFWELPFMGSNVTKGMIALNKSISKANSTLELSFKEIKL